jgi:hypothetical protein
MSESGFWACFYCANTHQFTSERCKCSCHENEPTGHKKQNAEWCEMRIALEQDQKKLDDLAAQP